MEHSPTSTNSRMLKVAWFEQQRIALISCGKFGVIAEFILSELGEIVLQPWRMR